jgi:hypothetical protein
MHSGDVMPVCVSVKLLKGLPLILVFRFCTKNYEEEVILEKLHKDRE